MKKERREKKERERKKSTRCRKGKTGMRKGNSLYGGTNRMEGTREGTNLGGRIGKNGIMEDLRKRRKEWKERRKNKDRKEEVGRDEEENERLMKRGSE